MDSTICMKRTTLFIAVVLAALTAVAQASISGWSGGAPTDVKGHFVFWTPHKDNILDVYCDDYNPALKVEIDTLPITISLKHH